jgi:hypothetical protein
VFGRGERFRPAVYWVKVSVRPLGIDCLPLKLCRVDWSNARPVVVPHRSG